MIIIDSDLSSKEKAIDKPTESWDNLDWKTVNSKKKPPSKQTISSASQI